MKRFNAFSSQAIAALGSVAVTAVLMAYAIIPASPSVMNTISPVIA
jgi:hypothetical protein